MQKIMPSALAFVVMLIASSAVAATYAIPADQINLQKVYWGVPTGFNKPAEVNYEAVVKATPEYKELRGVERGSGKYWILLSRASDRAIHAITEIGENTDFDFIAAKDYIAKLKPAIPAVDITDKVINEMSGKDGGVTVANANKQK